MGQPELQTSPALERRSAVRLTAPSPRRPAAGGPAAVPERAVERDPWELAQERWDQLEPRGLYARRLRTPFLWSCAAILAPPALLAGTVVALLNWAAYGSPRRILFAQERVGLRGRTFRIYKFRTMRGRRLEGEGSERDRERVTSLGRFLRNTHLDELPQLINVFAGDMALVGPRPEMIEIERWAADAVPGFAERLVLRPGVTGWAQVTQGYTTVEAEAYRAKLAANREYLERVSLWTDVSILLRTALWVLRASGWREHRAPARG